MSIDRDGRWSSGHAWPRVFSSRRSSTRHKDAERLRASELLPRRPANVARLDGEQLSEITDALLELVG